MKQPPFISRLVDIAREASPFTVTDGQSYVRTPTGCVFPIRSTAFRNWFYFQVYAKHDTIPTANAYHAILNLLESQALAYETHRLSISRRVAGVGIGMIPDQVLLHLADDFSRYVEIGPEGWKVASSGRVIFETSRSTLPLPQPKLPEPGAPAPLDALRSLLNLPSRADWLRCLAWLIAALRPYGPYPFLILQGPPGSGKTFATRVLRNLIDPSTAPLSPIPASVRDLLALARQSWILAFDHMSTLSRPLTDALCRLSSGLGAAVQETYHAAAQPLFQYYKRPVILNVTSSWSCPPEIDERAITISLPPLPPECRRPELTLVPAFEQALPGILAALCAAISTALARLPQLNPAAGKAPDALAWAIAAAPALGSSEDEMREALAPPPPPHPMVEAVRALIDQRTRWTGTATELLDLLQPALSCHTPTGVSHQLRKCTLRLADEGIELKFRRLHGGERIIELSDESGDAWDSETPPHASPDFAPPSQPAENTDLNP